jgi:hypothetical protein
VPIIQYQHTLTSRINNDQFDKIGAVTAIFDEAQRQLTALAGVTIAEFKVGTFQPRVGFVPKTKARSTPPAEPVPGAHERAHSAQGEPHEPVPAARAAHVPRGVEA